MWKLALLTTALVAIAALNLGAPEITAGPSAFVVDTTSDDPDLDTEVAACDTGSGCSLRAAIEQANADGSGVITFDSDIFPPDAAASIELDATGNGELPEIGVPLTIDGSGAGVVIEPAVGSLLDYGLFARDPESDAPTDFTIIGNSLTLRGFRATDASDDADGDAVVVCGDQGGGGCGTATVSGVTIGGLAVEDVAGSAIRVSGGEDSAVVVDGNEELSGGNDGSDAAVDIRLGDGSSVELTGNAGFTSGDDAIDVRTGTESTITITDNGAFEGADDGATIEPDEDTSVVLSNNGDLTATDGDAIAIEGTAIIDVTISGNGALTGGDNAVELELGDDATLTMTDNGDLSGTTDPAIQLELGDDADVTVSGHEVISTVENAAFEGVFGDRPDLLVSDNGSLTGESEGAAIETGEEGTLSFVNNDEIVGQNDHGIAILGGTPAVQINLNGSIVGQVGAGIDIGGSVTGGAIADNGSITGSDGRGIDISAQVPGAEINDLAISGNTIENSSEAGIRLECDVLNGCVGGDGTVISGNVLTNNGLQGVLIEGPVAATITENTITDNGGSGVYLFDSSNNLVSLNVIERNGTDTTGVVVEENTAQAVANTISRNSMAANIGLGIDLGADGVTPNDPGDLDEGANGLLNAPEGLAIDVNTVTGQACAECLVEVFVTDDPPDESGYGEGMTFLADGTADGGGSFAIDIPCDTTGVALTATATDAGGNTSEFSVNLSDFADSLSCATATPTETAVPPTATPSPTDEPLPDGDVNKDGMTNSVDALLILQVGADLLPALPNPENADVNQDGDITSVDAQLILQFDAGLIDSLPV